MKAAMANMRELFEKISERFSPADMRTFTTLIEDFRFRKIGETQLLTSLLLLFEKHESFYLWLRQFEPISPKARAESPKKDVSEGKNVTQVFDKIGLEGKKRGIMYSARSERILKKTRMSRGREQVTPSYRRIPEDEQTPVSHPALNNTYVLIKMY